MSRVWAQLPRGMRPRVVFKRVYVPEPPRTEKERRKAARKAAAAEEAGEEPPRYGAAAATDARVEFFKSSLLPLLKDAFYGFGEHGAGGADHGGNDISTTALASTGLVIYVPSYFDFVRVRNLLRREGGDIAEGVALVSEYTPGPEAQRAKSLFQKGEKRAIVVTERYQWYYRHKLAGARQAVFLQPPEFAEHFEETVLQLERRGKENGSALVLFTRYDALALERLVGTDSVKGMLVNEGGGKDSKNNKKKKKNREKKMKEKGNGEAKKKSKKGAVATFVFG